MKRAISILMIQKKENISREEAKFSALSIKLCKGLLIKKEHIFYTYKP